MNVKRSRIKMPLDIDENMCYKYFPIAFSSYEDYVKYLIEKGFAIEVTEENNPYKE